MREIPEDIRSKINCDFGDYQYKDAVAIAVLEEREAERARCMKTKHIIARMDETALIGLVMALTGGSANPSVIREQIRRRR